MTIINGIEIDDVKYIENEMKTAILNNDPLERVLHVVMVISNPCQFAQRYILAREFALRMEEEKDVLLYIVELAYNKQGFHVTDSKNPRHLQLKGSIPLWHKENMINIGIKKLLPPTWKVVAWIDADIEFENPEWAKDTLKILNGSRDIVQLFSHAIDMDSDENAMSVFPSFGFQFTKKRKYGLPGVNNMWHPGFAWACTRKAYEKIGSLYEESILGAGDHNMSLSLLNFGLKSVNPLTTEGYKESVLEFQKKAKNLRLGYVPGIIRHYFHGSKENRKYMERWKILVDHSYDPSLHITRNKDGLLIPTPECPKGLLEDILKYFAERMEDNKK